MATIVADTHKVITKLVERGYTKDQAEAFTEVLQDLDLSELATAQGAGRLVPIGSCEDSSRRHCS